MALVDKTVFISYRRNTSAMLATLLSTRLSAYELTPYVDTLMPSGGSFPDRLVQAIRHSDVFVCLLADTTLESEWVRNEIEHAHQFRKPMIPVFQETYKTPTQDALNSAINALLRNDGIHVFDVKNVYVDEAIERLAKMIKVLVPRQR